MSSHVAISGHSGASSATAGLAEAAGAVAEPEPAPEPVVAAGAEPDGASFAPHVQAMALVATDAVNRMAASLDERTADISRLQGM